MLTEMNLNTPLTGSRTDAVGGTRTTSVPTKGQTPNVFRNLARSDNTRSHVDRHTLKGNGMCSYTQVAPTGQAVLDTQQGQPAAEEGSFGWGSMCLAVLLILLAVAYYRK
jgi:hypothetical protein